MNNNIPNRNPFSTRSVCFPWNDASRITSRHHWDIVNMITIKPNNIRKELILWIFPHNPVNKNNAPAAPVKGQGLASTIWYGCFTKSV